MAANNLAELEKELNKELRKSMIEAKNKALADMEEETSDYYEGTDPTYVRTYALRDTPKTSDLSIKNNDISFNAYLDQTHQYTTGDNPTMAKVLNLANYGKPWKTASGALARQTVGKKGFWERAENKMEKSLDDIISKNFG